MGRIDSKLAELGIVLPDPAPPVANYVPYVVAGNLVFISGQVSSTPDQLIKGKLGADLSLDDGVEAARACGINLIAQLKAAAGGDLDRVRRVVKLGGFVNCAPDFADHPKVINGASDLMVAVFGEAGRHARAAVGAPSLPMGAAVEIDGVFEIA
ncbi:RidA family protein [Amphiplicatus metriothermophilus]|uniref:Enamine deaminase RidA, house cleaning of reactive enamine intermediates, YjgF/YER057c/UK114 family n=1 Tax=Amphiplicatus metriothermophilus TaxID=1519374 RepID=A0A239PPX0_9PROT|nr:RidA family protein [Amphiplicatus metriothermophilus]MBB5518881.1 enamine deaminase RidA (YjgF/YER057c/UK114 family) [Amphiplicatus metriothermophilus]SNT71966.1 Enamine deaminase RidA, house cleaning of reactive enamine intermediates, YjgF/YER057c/UK114 family [Amphiplicatus metriothermophilus]